MGERIFRWSERLRAIGQTGLAFEPHQYDAERYHEVLALAAEIQAYAMNEEANDLLDAWRSRIGRHNRGYVTPQTSVIAVVKDPGDRVLLLQRPDSGGWFPPAGWADVGLAPQAVAVKEVREETGYLVRPVQFLGCYDSYMRAFSPIHFYCLFWGCKVVDGEMVRNELEALEVGWFARDEVPAPLHGGDWWVPMAFDWEPHAQFDPIDIEQLEALWK